MRASGVLTMNTYTMLGVMDTAAAVEALPAIPAIIPQEGRLTDTAGWTKLG